jgi:hypothetical protein
VTTIDKRTEDLLIAILAEISLQGTDTLRMSDRKFHEHFGRALELLKSYGGELEELANQFYKNVVTDTYDELDHSLITAEQFGFVKFPNPSYSRLTIAITPRMARRLLKDWSEKDRSAIRDAAKEIARQT